jgi:hypothetical protein
MHVAEYSNSVTAALQSSRKTISAVMTLVDDDDDELAIISLSSYLTAFGDQFTILKGKLNAVQMILNTVYELSWRKTNF